MSWLKLFLTQNERCSIMMKFFTVLLIFIAAIVTINLAISHSEEKAGEVDSSLVMNQMLIEDVNLWHHQ